MHKEKLEELIQLDLDGRATHEERLAIAEALEHDPEARAIHAKMREVHLILDSRPKVDPPDDLRRRIATEVRRLAPRPTEAPPVSRIESAPRRHQRVMQFTLAAAAVLALAVLLVPALVRDTDSNQMRGTMAAPPAANSQEDVVLLAGNGVEGVVVTAWEGAELVLRPELRSPGPGRLEVGFDPGQLKLLSGGSADRSKGESGLVTATLDSSPYEIRFLRQSGDPLSLSLTLSKGDARVSSEVRFEASTNFSRGRL